MFSSFMVSVNAVIPMFILIALGYFCRNRGIVDQAGLKQFNNIAFRVFLPCQLFKNIYDSDLSSILDVKLVVFSLTTLALIYLFATIAVRRREPVPQRQGVMIQAIFRSNFVLLGLPLAQAILGDDLGPIPLMIGIIVPTFNVLAVITLEVYRGTEKIKIAGILLNILKNPLIIGSVAGLLCRLLNFNILNVSAIKITVTYLAQAAVPVSLFVLGATFRFSDLQKNKKAITFCTLLRLVLIPAIVLPIGVLLQFRGAALVMLLGAFATPPAANSYTMALQMGGDADLAGNLVVVGTSLSCLTLFAWIFCLKQLGFC